MRIEAEIRYEAGPEAVGAMLADPTVVDRKCAATGALQHTVDVQGDATGPFTVTTVRTMPTDNFPDVARRFVGDTIDIRQEDVWNAPAADGSRTGVITVAIGGAPLRLNGTLRLDADGEGTRELIDGDLKASVPVLGGKLEKASEPALRMAIRKEQQVGTDWLAR